MTKAELIGSLAAAFPEVERERVSAATTCFFDRIAGHVATGGKVELRGFGWFARRRRSARVNRSPLTGTCSTQSERWAPFFRPFQGLVARLTASREDVRL